MVSCNFIIFLKMSLTILLSYFSELTQALKAALDKIGPIILSSHEINWYIYIILFEMNKANIDINMIQDTG